MKTSVVAVLLLLLLDIGALQAQNRPLRLEEVVLPYNVATIDCLFEDSRGFLWIGTYSGLYRYDGYELLPFHHDPKNPNSLGDNKVKSIAEDSIGNLWVGTQLGLEYFDLRKRRFIHFTDADKHGIGRVCIYDLAFDRQGGLWAATAGGLYHYQKTGERFEKYFPQTPEATLDVIDAESAGNGVYAASRAQLYLIIAGHEPRNLPLPAHAGKIQSLKTHSPDATLWISTSNGLFCYDPAGQKTYEIPELRGRHIKTMVQRGSSWILGADKGAYLIDPATRKIAGPVPAAFNGGINPADNLSRGTVGASGITWLGAETGKLYKHVALKERFQHAPIDLTEPMKHAGLLCELYEYSPGVLLLPGKHGTRAYVETTDLPNAGGTRVTLTFELL